MSVNFLTPSITGIIAALIAPLFMSIGFFIWDTVWSESGASAFSLNMYKCNVASIGFIIMSFARGFAISSTSNVEDDDIEGETSVFTTVNVGYLILSSFLGIILGDILWLEALHILGAKQVIVIDSMKPFAAAILGRVALNEVLMPPAWGGMILTVLGVGIVAFEEQRSSPSPSAKPVATQEKLEVENATDASAGDDKIENNAKPSNNKSTTACISVHESDVSENMEEGLDQESSEQTIENNLKRGYICAIVNVLADSLGSLLTKRYGKGMTTWSINLIRFGFSGSVLVGISAIWRLKHRISRTNTKDDNYFPRWFELPTLTTKGWAKVTLGVVFVTFLCPALSNYSLFQIALGLAVSLGSIAPLYALLLDWPFKGKLPTACSCVGVLFAIVGVVILCLWGA